MKFSILYMLVFWCYSTSANQKTQEELYHNNVEKLKVLQCINNSDAWQKHFRTQKVIYNEDLTNLYKKPTQHDGNMKQNGNKMPEKSQQIEDALKLIEQNRRVTNIVFKTSNIVYLTIKCKYSGLIIDSLRVFNDIISSCQTIKESTYRNNCINDTMKHFVEQKPYFVRMMHNLFNFIEAFPNVKFANLILLKSLIRINLFLNYHKISIKMNKNYSVRLENAKNTIVQMMNFVERFRCQKCNVFNYKYDSDNSEITEKFENHENHDSFEQLIIDIFKPMSESLESCSELISMKSLDSQKTNWEIFDFSEEMLTLKPKYSKINDIMVKGKNMAREMKFRDILVNALYSYDLKTIFDFQMLFIHVIIDLCNIHFIRLGKTKMRNDDGTSLVTAMRLLAKIRVFIALLPNNYNQQSELLELYDSIDVEIQSSSESPREYLLRERVVDKIKINTIVNWESQRSLKDIWVSDLIIDVVHHDYFRSFAMVLKLFLSEPNALYEYRSYNVKRSMVNTNGEICFAMSQLRQNLILFQILVSGRKEADDGTDFALLKATDSMNVYLAHFYNDYGANYEIVKMLVPISIRFRNISGSNMDEDGYSMLAQQSLLTTNILEHFEINNCALVEFSDELYSRVLSDDKIFHRDNNGLDDDVTDFDENYIAEYLLRGRKTPKGDGKYAFLSWVDKFIPNYFSKYYNSALNSKTINWDGTEDRVNDVALSVKEDNIDYDYLVRFQMFKLKWSVYNVFKKMLYIAVHRVDYQQLEAQYFIGPEDPVVLGTILDDLTKIQRLPFPKPIRKYLTPIFLKYSKIFAPTDSPGAKKSVQELAQLCVYMIREQMEYLEVTVMERLFDEYEMGEKKPKITLETIHQELVDDYNFISIMLNPPKEGAIKLISEYDFFYVY